MKKYELLTGAEKKWIDKTFTKEEKLICELLWGGIPMDEDFIRNSSLFKDEIKRVDSSTGRALVSKTKG